MTGSSKPCESCGRGASHLAAGIPAARRLRARSFHGLALALAVATPLSGTALLLSGGFSPARAQTRLVEIGENKVGAVRVTQGKSQTLQTSLGFVDLVVGDPEIADVMPLTDRSLYVLGKKIGTTNISVYDGGKQLAGVIEVEVAYNTPKLAADVARAAPEGGARVSSANGRTVLSGSVADASTAARAVSLAKQYGPEVVNDLKVRGSQQVMLEVRFVEASRNAGKELGVRWNVMGQNARPISSEHPYQQPDTAKNNVLGFSGLAGLASGTTPFGAIVGRVLSNGIGADVLIQALEEKGLARRLAEPNLIAMSGEKASFLAGGEFPIPVSAERDKITVDYKKFGVMLNFLPTVLSNGIINLKVEPEVSQLDYTNAVSTNLISVPALIVRRASTVVELRDGQSFAIAGLLQSVGQEKQDQLPWLGDVPVLGALFRSSSFEKKETDLAIIVTARLVKPARPGQRLRTPLDNTSPANDADRFLMGQLEGPASAGPRAAGLRSGHILDLPKRASAGDAIVAKN